MVLMVHRLNCHVIAAFHVGLVYWGLTPQQQPGSYQGSEMMMKSVSCCNQVEKLCPEETRCRHSQNFRCISFNHKRLWKFVERLRSCVLTITTVLQF